MTDQIRIVDIGINLTNHRFLVDLEQVIQRAGQAGVDTLILTGTSLKKSQEAQKLCQIWKNNQYNVRLYFTAGIHPHDAKSWQSDRTTEKLRILLQDPLCVAVGECGLDFNRMFSPQSIQEQVFQAHLDLAIETKKPLFLHERDAFESFYQILSQNWSKLSAPAVVHCFTGTQKEIDAYVKLGCYLGFTGFLTDPKRGLHLPNLSTRVPLDHLMIETDGPFLLPYNLPTEEKKKARHRCEPAHCYYVLEAVHQAHQKAGGKKSLAELAEICYQNSCRFFNLHVPDKKINTSSIVLNDDDFPPLGS